MSTPATAAGRALLGDGYPVAHGQRVLDAILAIEAEAATGSEGLRAALERAQRCGFCGVGAVVQHAAGCPDPDFLAAPSSPPCEHKWTASTTYQIGPLPGSVCAKCGVYPSAAPSSPALDVERLARALVKSDLIRRLREYAMAASPIMRLEDDIEVARTWAAAIAALGREAGE